MRKTTRARLSLIFRQKAGFFSPLLVIVNNKTSARQKVTLLLTPMFRSLHVLEAIRGNVKVVLKAAKVSYRFFQACN